MARLVVISTETMTEEQREVYARERIPKYLGHKWKPGLQLHGNILVVF